ncbi:Catechol O-methyltransferase [Phytophthora megakarya]|uniref:Catechol O-methyltransferase n=1 Tax=Phytophthora megakarya TaxID=4795 RepID=A0A225UUG5_9STRA|nr:Catechol O-methyltransferase [Phytophthora megakarya]
MKFIKSLFRKTSGDETDKPTKTEGTLETRTLPAIDLTRSTRPVTSNGTGEKKPKVSKLTLYMLMSDM